MFQGGTGIVLRSLSKETSAGLMFTCDFITSKKTLIHCICHLSQKYDINDIMGLKNYVHSLSSVK